MQQKDNQSSPKRKFSKIGDDDSEQHSSSKKPKNTHTTSFDIGIFYQTLTEKYTEILGCLKKLGAAHLELEKENQEFYAASDEEYPASEEDTVSFDIVKLTALQDNFLHLIKSFEIQIQSIDAEIEKIEQVKRQKENVSAETQKYLPLIDQKEKSFVQVKSIARDQLIVLIDDFKYVTSLKIQLLETAFNDFLSTLAQNYTVAFHESFITELTRLRKIVLQEIKNIEFLFQFQSQEEANLDQLIILEIFSKNLDLLKKALNNEIGPSRDSQNGLADYFLSRLVHECNIPFEVASDMLSENNMRLLVRNLSAIFMIDCNPQRGEFNAIVCAVVEGYILNEQMPLKQFTAILAFCKINLRKVNVFISETQEKLRQLGRNYKNTSINDFRSEFIKLLSSTDVEFLKNQLNESVLKINKLLKNPDFDKQYKTFAEEFKKTIAGTLSEIELFQETCQTIKKHRNFAYASSQNLLPSKKINGEKLHDRFKEYALTAGIEEAYFENKLSAASSSPISLKILLGFLAGGCSTPEKINPIVEVVLKGIAQTEYAEYQKSPEYQQVNAVISAKAGIQHSY